jgi:transcriptional regulator with XRE-family HTH domain
MTIGAMIRKAREKKGMTQAQLGRALGCKSDGAAQVVVSKYENDVTFPARKIPRLVKVLGLPKKRVMDMAMAHLCSG